MGTSLASIHTAGGESSRLHTRIIIYTEDNDDSAALSNTFAVIKRIGFRISYRRRSELTEFSHPAHAPRAARICCMSVRGGGEVGKKVHKKKQRAKLQLFRSFAKSHPHLVSEPDGDAGWTVKPLVVLDLNGVLVERTSREEKTADGVDGFGGGRGYMVRVARDDLQKIMQSHAIGVWSSAHRKTVRAILKAVYGDLVDQFLFIWGQERCKGQDCVERGQQNVFTKPLGRVFSQFRCWNEINTILIDDSSEKLVQGDRAFVYKSSDNDLYDFIVEAFEKDEKQT